MDARKWLTAAGSSLVFLVVGAVAATPATQDPGRTGAGIIRLDRCTTSWADTRLVSSKIPGRIDRRLVNDGQEVSEGEVLALLDSREVEIELAIQDILGNSEIDEKSSREKLREYMTRLDIAEKLYGPRAISEEEYRLAKVNVEVNRLQTEKEVEKRVVEQKKADRARVLLDDHIIRSPIHGIIKKCFKREKESVTTNDLQMFDIVATDKVWVEGLASVNDLYRVKVGQRVEVRLSFSDPDRSTPDERRSASSTGSTTKAEPRIEMPQEKLMFPGKIVFINPDASFSARNFQVRAEVDNQYDPETGDPILRAGLNATMQIFLKPAERN